MISILIPIYNYNVISLAKELNKQCQNTEIQYEIVCYDDCSKEEYRKENRLLDAEFNVSYLELSENMGRAKIRNWLAKNARYNTLIFLDCDSEITNPRFIANYTIYLGKKRIIYGGRNYEAKKPTDEKKILHWTYGHKRESLNLSRRLKIPYRSFQTNNFMIERDLMLSFPFDNNLKTYGYEDLLFAETLKNEGIPIHHIENPLIHKGVEDCDDFLRKSALAAENLAILYQSHSIKDTKMVAFHEKLKKIGFNSLLHNWTRRKKDRILKNLYSKKPNLKYFDLYRYDIFVNKLNALETSSS